MGRQVAIVATCLSFEMPGPLAFARWGGDREAQVRSLLVIGYGNPYRRDDGVALVVVNGLRVLRGQPPLEEGMDGLEELGGEPDTLFVQQLTPELAEVVSRYEEVVFVDAHMGECPQLLREVSLEPAPWPAIVSHQLRPQALLALARALFGKAPRARLLSIKGHDFDFGTELSHQTREGAERAVMRIWGRWHPS